MRTDDQYRAMTPTAPTPIEGKRAPSAGPHPTQISRIAPSTVVPSELHRDQWTTAELMAVDAGDPYAELATGQAPGFTVRASVSVRDSDDETVRTSAAPWSAIRGRGSDARLGTVRVRTDGDRAAFIGTALGTVATVAPTPLRSDLPMTQRSYRYDHHQERYVLVARLGRVVVDYDLLTTEEWAALVADGWGAGILPRIATTSTSRPPLPSTMTEEERQERKRQQTRERVRRHRAAKRAAAERDAAIANERADAEAKRTERERTNAWQHV